MPYGNTPKEKKDFRNAVEEVINDIDIPTRSIGEDHIRSRSVKPSHCDLGVEWNFTGVVNFPLGHKIKQQISLFKLESVRVFEDYCLRYSPVVFVDSSKRDVSISLPESSAFRNCTYIIKRTDSSQQFGCTVTAATGDTIEGVTSIPIPVRGSLVCISSGFGWHILANYS